jgi:hypothetical protein
MPAEKFTKKADTPKRKRQWEHVYASAKASGDSPGTAIKKASGVVKKSRRKKRKKRKA